MNYLLHLAIIIGIYSVLAYSLNLTLGFGGLVSFCHAAFYGIGAYAYALLVTAGGVRPVTALLGTVVVTALTAFVIGLLALRFRGDMFLFVTLGFQMVVFVVLYNWMSLTKGPYGIGGIPRPELLGYIVKTPLQYTCLALAMNVVILPLLFMLYGSPFGSALKALREDEAAAEALGINPLRIFLQAFVISAAFASIPGAFFATYVTYIDPTAFDLGESIFLVAILLLGGSGNWRGPIVGVVIMLLVPEGLRFVGLPAGMADQLREVIYGLLLVLLMYLRPQGVAGEFKVA